MPTLPLVHPATCPDAWHRVTAPGGYEWWYFDAEDPATDTRLVAILLDGFVFHPAYLRRYQAYRSRPTRRTPPTARDYPCAYFVVYRGGKILAQFITQYPPGTLTASADTPEVSIGPNTLRRDPHYQLHLEGSPWHLTWQGPRRPGGASLQADLTFAPAYEHAPHERTFLSPEMTGADHRWVLAAPLCRAHGVIRFTPAAGEPEQVIEFTGQGYHDHNYGTAPLGPGLRRWTWGRVLLPDRAVLFHVAEPRDRRLAIETHLVRADANDIREQPGAHCELTGWHRTSIGLAYPGEMRVGELLLTHPRVIDNSPFYLRAIYDAPLPGAPHATAFCEVAYPHRLRWPLLGRMIESSIDVR